MAPDAGNCTRWKRSVAPARPLRHFGPRPPRQLEVPSAIADLREVAVHLQAEPELGAAADRHFQSHRHFGGNAAIAVDHTIELLPRDAERLAEIGDGHAQSLDFILQSVSRVGRLLHHPGLRQW